MQVITRKKGNFKPLIFNVDFTALGKTVTDVEDIYFVIKQQDTDADADAVMLKTMIDGITISQDSIVVVPWTETEYGNFVIGRVYRLGLFIKFTGDPVADEDVTEQFEIKITQDFLHDN